MGVIKFLKENFLTVSCLYGIGTGVACLRGNFGGAAILATLTVLNLLFSPVGIRFLLRLFGAKDQ